MLSVRCLCKFNPGRAPKYRRIRYVTSSSFVTGEYGVHIKYDDEHVPDSPVIVQCIPTSEDAKACSVHGLRDRGLDVSTC